VITKRQDTGQDAATVPPPDYHLHSLLTWAAEGAMRWYADPAKSLTMTMRVVADTRAWRSEADRIMGLWDERLIGEPVFQRVDEQVVALLGRVGKCGD
jgi:hypothetical protein